MEFVGCVLGFIGVLIQVVIGTLLYLVAFGLFAAMCLAPFAWYFRERADRLSTRQQWRRRLLEAYKAEKREQRQEYKAEKRRRRLRAQKARRATT